MTYALMSVPFLVLAAVALAVARRRLAAPAPWALAVALAVLLALTAVFDNVMIGIGLVAYGDVHRTGLAIGLAPIEDFAYPVAAVLLLPALWHLLGGRVDRPAAGVAAEPNGSER